MKYLVCYPSTGGDDHTYVRVKGLAGDDDGGVDRTASLEEATAFSNAEANRIAKAHREPFFRRLYGTARVMEDRRPPASTSGPLRPETTTVEVEELTALRALRDAVLRILDQEDDDHCWRDVYIELARLAGRLDWTPTVLPADQMLANCRHFIACLHSGVKYVTPADEQVVKALRKHLRLAHSRHTNGFPADGDATEGHRIALMLKDPETGHEEELGDAVSFDVP